jgi:hypothetical protein
MDGPDPPATNVRESMRSRDDPTKWRGSRTRETEGVMGMRVRDRAERERARASWERDEREKRTSQPEGARSRAKEVWGEWTLKRRRSRRIGVLLVRVLAVCKWSVVPSSVHAQNGQSLWLGVHRCRLCPFLFFFLFFFFSLCSLFAPSFSRMKDGERAKKSTRPTTGWFNVFPNRAAYPCLSLVSYSSYHSSGVLEGWGAYPYIHIT